MTPGHGRLDAAATPSAPGQEATMQNVEERNTEDVRDRTADKRIGIIVTGAAVVGLASSYLVQGVLDVEPGYDVRGFLIGTAVALTLAAVLFGKVVSRALHAADDGNRPATVGLITSVFAFLGIAVFWLGVPLVAAGASIALARRGQERAERSGGRGRANAALAIAVFVVLATVAVLVNDILGHFDMGFQPPAE
jgi:hypothetical protein